MKPIVAIVVLVTSTNTMAYDFETEYAKFANDFARLRGVTVAMNSPAPSAPVITPLPEIGKVNELQLVDPKSPVRLGRNLQNPEMRSKMETLYNKPDTVVYSLTLE